MITKNKLNVWLDCDPGHDDMMAIIMCCYDPRINLLGISTSAGNSSIENTTQNALNILHQINKEEIVVIKGSPKPLVGFQETAQYMHGANGLDGANLKLSHKQAIQKEPYLEIYKRIMDCPDKVSFVNTGALTNLSILISSFPEIKNKIEQISIMAGAIGQGNWSPSAEFNILIDPIAARIVFQSGIRLTMVPLEVTHTALATEEIFEEFLNLKTELGQKLHGLFRFFQKTYKLLQDFQFPPVHDPTAVFYLLQKSQFVGRYAEVKIDIYPSSYGRTNCHFKSKTPNAFVCEKLNVKRFWQVMVSCLKSINQNGIN